MIVRKLVVSDGHSERELLLVGTIVVGRDPECQIHDLDALLSRRHAEFVTNANGTVIRDLKSRNGILVNGKKVPEHSLQPGDIVQLGHLHFKYVEETVVRTEEEHTRSHAPTDMDMQTPTMAPSGRSIVRPPRTASAQAVVAPVVETDDENNNDTMAPSGRAAIAAPVATLAAANPLPPDHDDQDATRMPGMRASAVAVEDADVTRFSAPDETRMPAAWPAPAVGSAGAASRQARIVANTSLVVIEASPECRDIMGARPDTILGGRLADALTRSLTFVASGDGPSTLSLSIARTESGRITVTLKAG